MMAWKLCKSLNGLRPLVILQDWLIFYRKGAIYKVKHDLKKPVLLCRLSAIGLAG